MATLVLSTVEFGKSKKSMLQRVPLLILFIALVIPTEKVLALEDQRGSVMSTPSSPPSSSRVTSSMNQLALHDEEKKINNDMQDIEYLLTELQNLREELSRLQFDNTRANEALAAVNLALKDVKQISSTARINRDERSIAKLGRAVSDLYAVAVEPYGRITDNFYSLTEEKTRLNRKLREILRPSDEEERFNFLPNTRKLSHYVDYDNQELKRADIEQDITAAVKEMEKITLPSLKEFFDKSRTTLIEHIDKAVTFLTTQNDVLITKKEKTQLKMADISKLLEAKAAAIDQGLVYAIYAMIMVLVLLFVAMYFFPPDIAKELLSSRALVEVLSMAFMLLTIIILGTGGKIGTETLGTLLGTIAGYIFTRKLNTP